MNAIRNTLRMARKDLKLFFKDRGQLAILFVLPLVLALMLGATALPLRDPVQAVEIQHLASSYSSISRSQLSF